MNGPIARKEYEQLKLLLNEHAYQYYVLDEPQIADHEYDQLYQSLLRTEKAHPGHPCNAHVITG